MVEEGLANPPIHQEKRATRVALKEAKPGNCLRYKAVTPIALLKSL